MLKTRRRALSLAGGLIAIAGALSIVAVDADRLEGQTAGQVGADSQVLVEPATDGWVFSQPSSYRWSDQSTRQLEALTPVEGDRYVWAITRGPVD